MTSTTSGLSARGTEAARGADEMAKLTALLENQFSHENPNGLVMMGIAENTLMQADLKQQLNQNLQLQDLDFTYGDNVVGSTRMLKGLSKLFNRYFNPVVPVLPEHIVTGGGLTAVMDSAIHLLCDPGDAVLVARPYYSGFDVDVSFRCGVKMVGVDIGPDLHPGSPLALEAFESTLASLRTQNVRARAVVLCNPHNPLGFNYPRETIVAYAKFCERHGLHLLSDEIYALSQFENERVPEKERVGFTSALSVDFEKEAGCDPARVHVLYGMSKDFCANGLRIGVIITQHNALLRKTFNISCAFMKSSSASDALWSWLLDKDDRLDDYVKTNQIRLRETFKYCQRWFDERGIPYFQSTASLFLFLDLRSYLRYNDDDGTPFTTDIAREQDLQMAFFKAGVFIGSGTGYHNPVPGFFRFTFSVRRDFLEVGLQRMGQVLDARKAVAKAV